MAVARDAVLDEWSWVMEEGFAGGLFQGGPIARVHVLSNEIEAQYLVEVLANERIDAVVQCYRDMAFDGIFIPQRGWGCILTREEDSVRASEIIRNVLAAITSDPGVSGD